MTQNHTPTPSPQSPATFDDAHLPDAQILDTNGHNLADYHWVPVLKKPRKDGWSPEKQRAFIEALADTGSVDEAAHSVDMSPRSAQKLRRSPGAESFDRAWSAAIHAASKKLLDEAFGRALVGSDEPVFDRDGNRVGRRFKKSDKMLQFLLRGYFPERFGHFANSNPGLVEASPPAAVAEALDHLLPAAPAEPHQLMAPEALADALEIADIMDGVLPRRYRDPEPVATVPFAQEVDRLLDDARRANAATRVDYDDALFDDDA